MSTWSKFNSKPNTVQTLVDYIYSGTNWFSFREKFLCHDSNEWSCEKDEWNDCYFFSLWLGCCDTTRWRVGECSLSTKSASAPARLEGTLSRLGIRRRANPSAGFPTDRTVFIASVVVVLSSLFCLRMIGWSYRAGDPAVGSWGMLRTWRWGDLRGVATAGTREEGCQLPDTVSLFLCLSQYGSSQVMSYWGTVGAHRVLNNRSANDLSGFWHMRSSTSPVVMGGSTTASDVSC